MPADRLPEIARSHFPAGHEFTKYAQILLSSKGNMLQALERAKQMAAYAPNIETVLRAAVPAATTTDPNWAGPLSSYRALIGPWVALLSARTLPGRLSLRRVPFRTRTLVELTPAAAQFVGNGLPIPVSAMSLATATVESAMCVSLVVFTDEVASTFSAATQENISNSMLASVQRGINSAFIDPGMGAIAGVRPGSITHGITPTPATGVTASDICRRHSRAA